MSSLQMLFQEGRLPTKIPVGYYRTYPHITSDPHIHGGLPHIKNTRILTFDILRAQLQGYSLDKMFMEFTEMGIRVTKEELEEAVSFSITVLNFLNEKNSK